MKEGKISEPCLKRSVLRQIKQVNSNVICGAGVGNDCAIFTCENGLFTTAVATEIISNPADICYPIITAVNNIVLANASPIAIELAFILPEDTEESTLAELMRYADETVKKVNVQIAGGHTENAKTVQKICVSVTAIGNCGIRKDNTNIKFSDMDVVMTKYVGLEGTCRLAQDHETLLRTRYPKHLLDAAAAYKEDLFVLAEAATAAKSNVDVMHDVSRGGIYAALWELAERTCVGLEIDLKKIPIRQETIEICEFFGISPYELKSNGCLLMLTKDGDKLVETFLGNGIPACVIGKTTDNHDRIIQNEEERRFLERPKTDSYNQIKEAVI